MTIPAPVIVCLASIPFTAPTNDVRLSTFLEEVSQLSSLPAAEFGGEYARLVRLAQAEFGRDSGVADALRSVEGPADATMETGLDMRLDRSLGDWDWTFYAQEVMDRSSLEALTTLLPGYLQHGDAATIDHLLARLSELRSDVPSEARLKNLAETLRHCARHRSRHAALVREVTDTVCAFPDPTVQAIRVARFLDAVSVRVDLSQCVAEVAAKVSESDDHEEQFINYVALLSSHNRHLDTDAREGLLDDIASSLRRTEPSFEIAAILMRDHGLSGLERAELLRAGARMVSKLSESQKQAQYLSHIATLQAKPDYLYSTAAKEEHRDSLPQTLRYLDGVLDTADGADWVAESRAGWAVLQFYNDEGERGYRTLLELEPQFSNSRFKTIHEAAVDAAMAGEEYLWGLQLLASCSDSDLEGRLVGTGAMQDVTVEGLATAAARATDDAAVELGLELLESRAEVHDEAQRTLNSVGFSGSPHGSSRDAHSRIRLEWARAVRQEEPALAEERLLMLLATESLQPSLLVDIAEELHALGLGSKASKTLEDASLRSDASGSRTTKLTVNLRIAKLLLEWEVPGASIYLERGESTLEEGPPETSSDTHAEFARAWSRLSRAGGIDEFLSRDAAGELLRIECIRLAGRYDAAVRLTAGLDNEEDRNAIWHSAVMEHLRTGRSWAGPLSELLDRFDSADREWELTQIVDELELDELPEALHTMGSALSASDLAILRTRAYERTVRSDAHVDLAAELAEQLAGESLSSTHVHCVDLAARHEREEGKATYDHEAHLARLDAAIERLRLTPAPTDSERIRKLHAWRALASTVQGDRSEWHLALTTEAAERLIASIDEPDYRERALKISAALISN